MKSNVLLTLALLSAAGPSAWGDDPQKPVHLSTQVKVELNYLLYLPKDYEQQDKWPLVMFLHGGGERGDDLNLVKEHGPPYLVSKGKDFPFILVSPQVPMGKNFEPFELVALLDDLEKKYKVDPDRLYVTGLSMGGSGAWRLAAYAPNRLAAIVPLCSGGEPGWTRNIGHLPVWAFHGAKDESPVERAQALIDAHKRNGGDPKFTIYPDLGHDVWTVTYENQEVYDWMLAQKRKPKS